MRSNRSGEGPAPLLTGLGGIALAAGAWSAGACRATLAAAEARMARRGSVIRTGAGPLEFAVAGHGEPLMMIHGAGGGFDQGLLFAHGLREAGFRIMAPSRFGYLRSAFPEDASPAHQADVLVDPTPEERIVRTHQLACDKGLAHAIVMPSVTDALLDRFVSDYASWWRGTTQLQVGAPLGAENARAPELAETGAAT